MFAKPSSFLFSVVVAAMGLALVSCSTPGSDPGAALGQPARFPQTPEILAMEKQVSQDPAVRDVLARRPGARVKLRKMDDHVTAYVVEQRDGKWFNVSNQLPAADLAAIAASVRRAGEQAGHWEPVSL